jgi:hypothetical protein
VLYWPLQGAKSCAQVLSRLECACNTARGCLNIAVSKISCHFRSCRRFRSSCKQASSVVRSRESWTVCSYPFPQLSYHLQRAHERVARNPSVLSLCTGTNDNLVTKTSSSITRISCSICTRRVGSSMPSKGSISSLPSALSTGGGKEDGWSYKVWDSQEFK